MSDYREALTAVVADAICVDRPSYSPDRACTAHGMQAEVAADALLASPILAEIINDEIAARYHPEFGTEWAEGGSLARLLAEREAAALRAAAAGIERSAKTCKVKRTCHEADVITLRERADRAEASGQEGEL